ncbi:DUF1648 domain-containing protein [Amycolatopsis samaneae]|uniref:DUF1648 domain-containing protein n=1 Tax=Amycolatopsis samaneae TaxID=664691 RepID=A0ABW5GAY3_9PSEU
MTVSTFLDLALIALITVTFWSAPALARPTLPFGVRVPGRRAAEPAIVRARHRYTRGVALLGALTYAVVGAVSLGFGRELPPALVLPILAACCCGLGYQAHRAVAAAKRDGDWYAGTRQAVATDTSLRTDPVRPQWILLAPAVALLVLTAGIGVWRYGALPPTLPTPNDLVVDAGRRGTTTFAAAFATVIAQLVLVLLIGLLAVALPRARPELDAARPAGSAAQYRAYLGGVLRLLFVSACGVTASLLVISLQVWEILPATVAVTVVGYLPLAAATVAWAVFAVRAGDAGHRLPAGETDDESPRVQRDDDRHWYAAGMIYLNRRDPAVLVHRRAGAVWTLNLGHPVSWAVLAAIALVAALAGFGVIELPTRG